MNALNKTLRLPALKKMIGWRAAIWLSFGILFSLLLSCLELLFAFYLANLLFLLQISGTRPEIPTYIPEFLLSSKWSLLLMLFLGAARTFLRVLGNQCTVFFGEMIHLRLRYIFFNRLYHYSTRRFSQSEMNTQLGEIFPKAMGFCTSLATLTTVAAQALFLFLFLMLKSPVKASLGFAAILVIAPIVKATSHYVRGLSVHVIQDFTNVQRSIVRASKNWLLIRVLGTEAIELTRLQRYSQATTEKSLRINFLQGIASGLPDVTGIFLIAMLIAVQYRFDPQSGAAFLTFLYLFLRFVQSLSAFGSSLGGLNANYPSYVSASDFIIAVPDSEKANAVAPLKSLRFFGSSTVTKPISYTVTPSRQSSEESVSKLLEPPAISVVDLGFKYNDEDDAVIQNLSFNVGAGGCLGVVGQSGAGKSTLLALLLGVLRPTAGSVHFLLSNEKITPSERKISVGYVGAEPFLVLGTVMDNLLYGASRAYTHDQMIDAMISAGFSEQSQDLSSFFSLPVSEDGEGLSTGQKQRLCLARALLVKPQLLILDEVSANLDLVAEERIASHVRNLKGQTTVIIVSHRPGMLKACDQILEIEKNLLRTNS